MKRGPLFSYYGAKWRTVPKYPEPIAGLPIVEPFAGSACYALRHEWPDVILVEKDPEIAAMWEWLIGSTADDVMSLPLLEPGQHVDTLRLPIGPATLIGFWLGQGMSSPGKTMRTGSWVDTHSPSFWGAHRRARIASMVHLLDGWRVICGDYTEAPDIRATWFIDPPYQGRAGDHYRKGSSAIDYAALGDWCARRDGLTIVCENDGAAWLPFAPLAKVKAAAKKYSREAVWTNRRGVGLFA